MKGVLFLWQMHNTHPPPRRWARAHPCHSTLIGGEISPQLLPCFVGPFDRGYKSPFMYNDCRGPPRRLYSRSSKDLLMLNYLTMAGQPTLALTYPLPPEIRVFLAGLIKDEGWLSWSPVQSPGAKKWRWNHTFFGGGSNLMQICGIVERFPPQKSCMKCGFLSWNECIMTRVEEGPTWRIISCKWSITVVNMSPQ